MPTSTTQVSAVEQGEKVTTDHLHTPWLPPVTVVPSNEQCTLCNISQLMFLTASVKFQWIIKM